MFGFVKHSQVPTILFVTASLAAFVLLGVFFLLIRVNFNNNAPGEQNLSKQYYLDENYEQSDPLITKVPNLRNILTGPIINQTDPSLGAAEALITIVEFSDFQCSYCQSQEKILKETIKQYQDKIKLIWKDYPEAKSNSISWQSAVAARCAGQQNKFWPYHDLLYNNSDNLNQDIFLRLAQQLSLNINQFNKCLGNTEIQKLIYDNVAEANALDINGVPFIYINNQEVMGEISLEELTKIIDLELSK